MTFHISSANITVELLKANVRMNNITVVTEVILLSPNLTCPDVGLILACIDSPVIDMIGGTHV